MKSYPMPARFSGTKFAARYNLDVFSDFYDDGQGNLIVLVDLPDDPPVFEPPDPPGPSPLAAAIDSMLKRTAPPIDPDLRAILTEWRKEL